MKVITKEFLNENAYTSYPIDSRATFEPYSKEDASAINSLLLDLKLTIPENLAVTAFVGNIKVTSTLVSMVIMGSKTTPYYEIDPPAPTYTSEEYQAFNAITLATVTVSRAIATAQNPIHLVGEIDGVGGWVVFGPGVQNICNWSFASPSSSAISSSAITRYKYQGVKTIAKKNFETTIDGAINIVGQNGIEVVKKPDNVLAIQFSGTTNDVQTGLRDYAGACGIRPETNTCAFSPIRTINNVQPKSGSGSNTKRQIVLVLDSPIYSDVTGASSPTFTFTSNQTLEGLCERRLQIPEYECTDTAAVTTGPATVITNGRKVWLEVYSAGIIESGIFEMVQTHPTRPSIAIFKPVGAIPTLLGEQALELHVDQSALQWQVYSADGPSLRLHGFIELGLSSNKQITVNNIARRIALGNVNVLDKLDYNKLTISVSSTKDIPDWTGVYIREHLNYYIRTDNKKYSLRISAINNSWSIYSDKVLVVAGSLDSTGFGMQVQNYKDELGLSQVRTVTAVGAKL